MKLSVLIPVYNEARVYFGRSRAEGKRIRLRDGFSALAALLRHSLAPRRRPRGQDGAG